MFLFLDLAPPSPPLHLPLRCQNMSNHDRVPCSDPHCTYTYDTSRDMQRHYTAKHTEERFPCRSPGCERHYSSDNPRVTHERKTHQLYHCRRDTCNQTIEGAQNWKLHQKTHRPHLCQEPGCDNGYTTLRSLLRHHDTAHTSSSRSQAQSHPRPSELTPVVPSPEPLLDERTMLPIPNGKNW